MAHFKQLTWRQHLAYLSCAVALAFSVAAYQKEIVSRNETLSAQSEETITLFKLRRSLKLLREKVSVERSETIAKSIALRMLRWESVEDSDLNCHCVGKGQCSLEISIISVDSRIAQFNRTL